jgi:hypothetical protein
MRALEALKMARTGRFLKAAAISTVAGVMVSGCLLKDASETWYVDANGAVTWVVSEKDVRSDAKALADRQQEESVYWLAVQQQRHPMAMGLQELGGTKLRTLVLRDQAPYTVQTEAKFTGIDEIGRRILAAVGAIGESTIKREGDVCEWTFVIRDPKSLGSTTEPSDNVTALMNEFASLKVVLMSGHFESAQGFTISNDDRVASFDEKFVEKQDEEQAITLKLKWKAAGGF